ncbi:oligosaccharide repeat unit polymerase [Siminovitchia sp. 179-K 8D1 HS]|uniref:oligosaccharide repeat unit polymerase n=1 Tax=Siminovitchia sp. 179-K 8D1 HS TaxID=3142385 RepID=UPI0039A08B37
MQYVVILFLFLCVFFSYIKEKNIYNPITLFSLYWLLVILFASLELYGLYTTSQQAYLFIGLGMFSFAFGYSIRIKDLPHQKLCKKETKFLVRYKLYIIINILIIIFLLFRVADLLILIYSRYSKRVNS